ncbi:MAG: DUF5654 family protein [Halobacteriota archaeon]
MVFGTTETLPGMLVYAVLVTILAIVATIWIGRAAEKAKR